MRRLSRAPDDIEHLGLGEIEDRQPVEPGPARAGVALAQAPGRPPRPRRAFFGAHAHGADDPAAEARVGLEISAKLALDGSGLEIRGTPAPRGIGPLAPFLDAVEQGLAGGNGREDQRYAGRERRPEELDRARPFDFGQRRMDGNQPVAGDEPRQEDRHGLRVLAAAGRDRHEGAGPDHVPALGGNADFGDAAGHGSVSPAVARKAAPRPPRTARRTPTSNA